MLNIGVLHEGFVLDHIEAGRSMEIYKYLNLDKIYCCVAIIKNALSNKMGKKDKTKMLENIEKEMKEAARVLDFERAAQLRDILIELINS